MKSSIETAALQTSLEQICNVQALTGLIKDATLGKVDAETEGNVTVITPKKVSDTTSLTLTQVGSKVSFMIAVHNGNCAAVVSNSPEVLARWVVKFINLL